MGVWVRVWVGVAVIIETVETTMPRNSHLDVQVEVTLGEKLEELLEMMDDVRELYDMVPDYVMEREEVMERIESRMGGLLVAGGVEPGQESDEDDENFEDGGDCGSQTCHV